MITCLPDSDIERFIEEDLPYGDLTTHLLGIGLQRGRITFTTREETTVCCTEEAARLFEKCGATVTAFVPSGSRLAAGSEILIAEGTAQSLHSGWKAALNLLEYASGIATRTNRIVTSAQTANPAVTVVTTRKSFPGTKKISIKAITAGGALPHRLGPSESILVFRQHTVFSEGLETFLETVPSLRLKAPEQKIIVEADTYEEALLIARASVDVVQVDKLPAVKLQSLVTAIRAFNASINISSAGGINEANAAEYAATGIDVLVLSSVYFGKPADMAASITPVT